MVDEFFMLGQEFIGLVEFLRDSVIKKDHLHSADLKPRTQNDIDNLPYIFVLDRVRFDDAKRAILAVCLGLYCDKMYLDDCLAGEDETELALDGLGRVATVTGIFGAVLAIECSERIGGFLLGLDRVGGSDESSPLGDGVVGH